MPKSDIGVLKKGAYLTPLTVGMGYWEKWSAVDKFGKNVDVDTAFEDIWTAGGTLSYLTSGEILEVFSSDANDDITGTGAQKIKVEGLDSQFNPITEEVELDGLEANLVETTQSFIRVFRAQVTQVGSGSTSTNIGTITIRAKTAQTTQAQITADEGQTQMALYTIPRGFTGYFSTAFVSTDTTNIIDAQLRVRPNGQGWQIKRELRFTTGTYVGNMEGSGEITEFSDIAFRALANNPNNEVTAGFKILLYQN